MDPESTFIHFQELGMPSSISLDDFRRMYSLNDGNFGTVIESIKGRLLGRQGTAISRQRIQKLREDFLNSQKKTSKSKIRPPTAGFKDTQATNLLEDTKALAKSKQESAERVLSATKLEWQVESERHDHLDKKVRDLQSQLRRKQEKLLLLSILEKREDIRMKRLGNFPADNGIQGIGTLLNDLRTESTMSVAALRAFVSTESTEKRLIDAKIPVMPAPKSRNTAEMIANLNAYHIRMRKSLDSPAPELAVVESQFESVVQRYHQKVQSDQSLEDTIRQFVDSAHLRAERKYKFRVSHQISETPTDQESSDKLGVQRLINQAKRQEIEAILREIIRLRLQAENNIDIISTFREEASTSLKEMLHDEQNRISGYVDILKDRILKQESEHESDNFVFQVRKLLGSSRVHVWEDLEEDLVRLQSSQGLVNLNLAPHSDQGDLTQRIDEVVRNVEKSGLRLGVLLERKGRKADYGFQLAEDIQEIAEAHRKMK